MEGIVRVTKILFPREKILNTARKRTEKLFSPSFGVLKWEALFADHDLGPVQEQEQMAPDQKGTQNPFVV